MGKLKNIAVVLFMIVFLAGILGFTTLASRIVERVQNMVAELSERATFGNRLWRFMAGMAGYPCL